MKHFHLLFCVYSILLFLSSNPSQAQWEPEVRLTNNIARSGNYMNSISSIGNIVHVLFSDDRDGNIEIYYKRSTDGGISWSVDTRLTNNSDSSMYPSVAVSGSTTHITWMDNRDGNIEIYYKRSTDNGANWGTDIRLTNTSASSCYPVIAASGSVVHIAWEETGVGVYYKRSSDGGGTWGTDVAMSNELDCHVPSLAVAGSVMHVVWIDKRNGNYDIFYKRSSDGGLNWSADTRISNSSSPKWNPVSIAASGSTVHVSWNYSINNIWTIYYRHSIDGGLNWDTDSCIVNSTASSLLPKIAASGTSVHIAWFDFRDTNAQIYYKRSTNVGVNWEPDSRLIFTDSNAVVPSMTLSDSVVHMVWTDYRNGNSEIYYKRNSTGNTTEIINTDVNIPDKFSLSQNYPNPFNPSTTIQFSLPKSEQVTLRIINVVGQEVETLIQGRREAGEYKVVWDSVTLPSGVYFYRLTAGNFSSTNKLILMK